MKSPSKMIEELLEAGLSQPKLATKLGISQASVSRILKEKVSPSFSTLQSIQKVYQECRDPKANAA